MAVVYESERGGVCVAFEVCVCVSEARSRIGRGSRVILRGGESERGVCGESLLCCGGSTAAWGDRIGAVTRDVTRESIDVARVCV